MNMLFLVSVGSLDLFIEGKNYNLKVLLLGTNALSIMYTWPYPKFNYIEISKMEFENENFRSLLCDMSEPSASETLHVQMSLAP